MQIPPTPTPIPPPLVLPFDVPAPSFWESTDQVITTWQMIPNEFVYLFQGIVLLLLIGMGISMVHRYIRRITNKYQVVD